MVDEHEETVESPRTVKVTDKRKAKSSGAEPEDIGLIVEGEVIESAGAEEAAHDYLEDLQRLQADFDNYRKRMMRDQASVAERAKGELIGRLLPVLDNFERALEHSDADPGVQLIFKELRSALEAEGLEEIAAQDQPFDPTVHEAVMSNDSDEVNEPTVSQVFRSGYSFKGSVVRPAMVVVARPAERAEATEVPEGAEGAEGAEVAEAPEEQEA